MGETSKRIGEVNQEIERESPQPRLYNVHIRVSTNMGDYVEVHLGRILPGEDAFVKNPLLKEVLYSLLETQLKAVDDSKAI